MSIIIKGLDMPKNGDYTFHFASDENGENTIVLIRNNLTGTVLVNNGVVEIPKGHGRLIDADETRTQYYQTMDELLQSTTINISVEALSLLCGLTLINNAPTILEAER